MLLQGFPIGLGGNLRNSMVERVMDLLQLQRQLHQGNGSANGLGLLAAGFEAHESDDDTI